jgi:NAD(P)-dependent dehydrogenase (short-subunit alcohol dehydrogenase family)
MRIAITGASGNVGSATLRRLGTNGEHQLIALARLTTANGPDGAEVEWVSAALTEDESWPTTDVPSSRYSLHTVGAERLLDRHEQAGHTTLISRVRPGIVGQRSRSTWLTPAGWTGPSRFRCSTPHALSRWTGCLVSTP